MCWMCSLTCSQLEAMHKRKENCFQVVLPTWETEAGDSFEKPAWPIRPGLKTKPDRNNSVGVLSQDFNLLWFQLELGS